MAERTTPDQPADQLAARRRAAEESTRDGGAAGAQVDGPPTGPEDHAPVQPEDLADVPGQGGVPLGDQSEGGGLSQAETPDAASVHDLGDSGGIEGPADQRADVQGIETGRDVLDLDELDDLLGGTQGVGGLDGRNPVGDAGRVGSAGEVPDFGDGGPLGHTPGGGFGEHAAGKLPAHQQAVLDGYDQEAREAAANGDYDAADAAAEKAQQFLQEVGAAPPDSGGDGGSKYDMVSNFGSGQEGPKQVWNSETGEVELVDGDTETNSEGFVTEAEQLKQTGTAASSEQQDGQPAEAGPPPTDGGGMAEDRTPDSGPEAPDLHRGFTDAYREHNWAAQRGADVDPNPNDDPGAVMDGSPDADHTDLHAEYEQGYVPDEADLEDTEIDSGIEEQFMDL